MWISNAGFCRLMIVFARIENDKNITGFIVEYDKNNPNGITLGDIDKTITISASDFIDGKADASYALNAQREYHNPIKPFKVENMQVSVDTTTVSKNVNGDSVVDSFDFYFGRVSVGDVKTNKTSSVEHKLEFEVYDPNNTLGFKRNSLNWSTNEEHDDTKFGEVLDSNFTSEPNGVTTSVSAPSAGSLTLTHGGTTSATMHVDIDKWFWYVPFDCGVACEYKSYTDGGDCKTHPCFNYTYKNTQDVKGVQTGTFSGSDFNTSTRGEYKKTGVKVFR